MQCLYEIFSVIEDYRHKILSPGEIVGEGLRRGGEVSGVLESGSWRGLHEGYGAACRTSWLLFLHSMWVYWSHVWRAVYLCSMCTSCSFNRLNIRLTPQQRTIPYISATKKWTSEKIQEHKYASEWSCWLKFEFCVHSLRKYPIWLNGNALIITFAKRKKSLSGPNQGFPEWPLQPTSALFGSRR